MVVDIADSVSVELQLTIVEAEERRARKLTNGNRREFVSSTINVQLLPAYKTFWVRYDPTPLGYAASTW